MRRMGERERERDRLLCFSWKWNLEFTFRLYGFNKVVNRGYTINIIALFIIRVDY